MSFKAVATVLNSDLRDGSEVAVLVALAHCLNDQTGKCCPSTATIARIARRSENIVRKTLKDLEGRGLLSSAQPAGGVRHFSLNLNPLQVSSGVADLEGVAEVQGVTEVEPPPCRSERGGVAEAKAHPLQICKPNREENKEDNKETNREGVAARAARTRSSAFIPPEVASGEIDRQVFDDWLQIRKAKRAPLTATAWSAIKREAEKAGLTLTEVVALMAEHSWQSFRASWDSVRNGTDGSKEAATNAQRERLLKQWAEEEQQREGELQ